MKTPVTRHEPIGVFPDLAPEKHDQSTAKSARNIRMNPTPPRGGQSRVRVDGNEEVPNSFLPDPETNVNWKVGGTKNDVTGQQYACNYNNNGDHAIYRFTEPDVWEVVIADSILNFKQGRDPEAADYVKDYVVNCLYHPSGLLLFQDGINEDRVINVERGIRTYRGETTDVYQLPIQPFVLAQLHRRPTFCPNIYGINSITETLISYVAATIPKPIQDITERSYQFGTNYGYMDGIESGICEASICNWNDGPYLIVSDEEFFNYMSNGVYPGTQPTAPNPYIVYVKFYYRLGNTNEWTLFKKVFNKVENWLSGLNGLLTPDISAGYHFGIILPKMEELQSIGGTSAAALSLVDGIGRSSKGTAYGDSRLLKWYPTFGFDAVLPSATTQIINNDFDFDARKWRFFAPIKQVIDLAGFFQDDRGRELGSVVFPSVTLWPDGNGGWQVDLKDVYNAGGGGAFDLDSLPWNQAVDYLADAAMDPQKPSQWDIRYVVPKIRITPDSSITLPAETASVTLLTRIHKGFSSFLRTQARPFFIYKNRATGAFTVWISSDLGESYTFSGQEYTFYGIGFQFSSGEPINFSTEQNYRLRVIGSLYTTNILGNTFGIKTAILPPNAAEYKITDQLGTILIAEYAWADLTSNLQFKSFSMVGLDGHGGFSPTTGTDRYGHAVVDVILYSKATTQLNTWNKVPSVTWNAAQWTALEYRDYFGDCYGTGDKKTMSTPLVQVFSSWFTGVYYPNNISLPWQGFWSSMNMDGIFEEVWDSDIGNTVIIDSEPKKQVLTKGMIHGEQYLPGAKINNMFVFNPLNKSQVTGDIGDLIMIFILAAGSSTGDNIYCLCTAGEEIRYLSKIQQTASNGEQVMSLSTNVFGNENTQPWRVGIQSQLEAVNTGEGQLFYFDRVKKVSMQVTLGGQDPVSIQQFQVTDMNTMNGPGVMGYDPFNNEFVYATANSGFAYNRVTKKYQGFRTFGIDNKTESFSFGSSEGSGKNKVLYGWSKGVMYRYGATGNVQSINGESYSASLTIVSAPAVPLLKNFASVRYLSLAGKVWSAFVTNPLGRESDITIAEFDAFAGYFKGSIARDINSEGGKYDGDIINGSWLEVEVLDEDNSPKDLNMIEIGYTPSLEQ